MNGKTSDWRNVTSRVPEGALLAPLMFAMYINDLPDVVSSHCVMFADDVKLYRRITCLSECEELQKDVNHLCTWANTWKLKLNPSKCVAFTMTLRTKPIQHAYSVDHTYLEHVSEVRDLGILLDSKLNFSSHINQVVSKANRALCLMIRAFQKNIPGRKFNHKTLLATYFANVRSIMEYGSVIWNGAAKTHIDRIERVQHKFLIWLSSKSVSLTTEQSLSYQNLLETFKLQCMRDRFDQHDVMFLKNVFSARIDSPFLLACFPLRVPNRATRQRTLFYEEFARVETVKNGIFRRVVRRVNNLIISLPDVDFFTSSASSLKAILRRNI